MPAEPWKGSDGITWSNQKKKITRSQQKVTCEVILGNDTKCATQFTNRDGSMAISYHVENVHQLTKLTSRKKCWIVWAVAWPPLLWPRPQGPAKNVSKGPTIGGNIMGRGDLTKKNHILWGENTLWSWTPSSDFGTQVPIFLGVGGIALFKMQLWAAAFREWSLFLCHIDGASNAPSKINHRPINARSQNPEPRGGSIIWGGTLFGRGVWENWE